jgi:hypothetical protein
MIRKKLAYPQRGLVFAMVITSSVMSCRVRGRLVLKTVRGPIALGTALAWSTALLHDSK